jgi:hypothetical protein
MVTTDFQHTGAAERTSVLRERIRNAVPTLSDAVGGTLFWAAAMGGSAMLGLALGNWATVPSIREVALLFALGGAIAFWPACFLSRLISIGRGAETAFASAFVVFPAVTIGLTAAIYALLYRAYYAQWHEEAFSLVWFVQFIFTVLAALYQFAVLGLRLYFPVGLVAVFAVSFWIARNPR